MEIFLLAVGFVFVCLGIVGSFLPILPGPLTGWFGLLLLHTTSTIPMDWPFLGITLALAIIIFILDYFIPAIGTKRFGGTKYGVYGTTIGLIIGLLSPIPFGMLLGAFFGAFFGFLASATIKFSFATVYFIFFIIKFWEYKSVFF
jgi:uncharacterized protein YqgC (DUF456 family)